MTGAGRAPTPTGKELPRFLALLGDRSSVAAFNVADALHDAAEPAAVGPILGVLSDPGADPRFVALAVRVAGEERPEGIARTLLPLLERPVLVAEVADALAAIGDPASAAPVFECLRRTPSTDYGTFRSLVSALDVLDRSWRETSAGVGTVAAVVARLEAPEPNEQLAAMKCAAVLGGPLIKDRLLPLLVLRDGQIRWETALEILPEPPGTLGAGERELLVGLADRRWDRGQGGSFTLPAAPEQLPFLLRLADRFPSMEVCKLIWFDLTSYSRITLQRYSTGREVSAKEGYVDALAKAARNLEPAVVEQVTLFKSGIQPWGELREAALARLAAAGRPADAG